MLSQKLHEAINAQINAELWSAYLYLAMSLDAENKGYKGVANCTDETNYELSSHEGEEFIHVMEGTVEIAYGKKHHVIEAGDSIYYDSIVPHHVHGFQGQAAKILAVVYTPI